MSALTLRSFPKWLAISFGMTSLLEIAHILAVDADRPVIDLLQAGTNALLQFFEELASLPALSIGWLHGIKRG